MSSSGECPQDPSYHAASVIVVDFDDVGSAELSQDTIRKTRQGQIEGFEEYKKQATLVTSNEAALHDELSSLFDGWDPDYWTESRIDEARQSQKDT